MKKKYSLLRDDVLYYALFISLYVFYFEGFSWIGLAKYLFSVLVCIPVFYLLAVIIQWFIRRYTDWEEPS